eukprot:TRINITY_DN2357_c0_g1_i1.p1 TRINITY_DN2357_c0_g1~~TRINITY_DN2357_c0_g1_i1.p1  ORF type:complete len:1061 (+),score=50.48 TRINITY_DN2357_c0_g1_i1:298-3480(+)
MRGTLRTLRLDILIARLRQIYAQNHEQVLKSQFVRTLPKIQHGVISLDIIITPRGQSDQKARDNFKPNEIHICDTITIEKPEPLLESIYIDSPIETPSRIDLAFLFASPLVSMYQGTDSVKLQPMARPDYELEFKLVMKNICDTHRSIKYTKAVATINNFQKCLNDAPTALHFSGHGLTNQAFSHDRSKEGDYLVFEDERGKAHYISCLELKKILASIPKQPEFVLVSSCHSRLVGEVFRAAGAKHVICVKRSEQMLDTVAQLFSKSFYAAFFASNSVCKAYENALATLEVEIAAQGLDPVEARKFELLIGGSGSEELHICGSAGGWADGTPEYISSEPMYTEVPALVEHFVGRKIEMYSLICLIAESRLVTVMGPPGIGKTSVTKALARHFLERGIFTDGVIYVSARGLESTDAVVNEIFLASCLNVSGHVSGISTEDDKLPLIVDSLYGKEVLLVLDNVEDPLNKDKARLLNAIHYLFTKLPKLKIVTTSRVALGPLPDYGEKIYSLYPLDPQSAVLLLEKRAPRPIMEQEFSELFDDSYPIRFTSNPWYDCTEEVKPHKLMQVLSGHPQAISLAAALLHTKNLSQLYQELSQNSMQPNEMASLKASLNLSIECLGKASPNSLRFFKMLALFPNGATAEEIKEVWGTDYLPHVSTLQENSLVVKKETESSKENRYWILPFMADYAFDCLKDCDITCVYRKCCKYHLKQLMGIHKNGKESIIFKQIPNEANILACLKRFNGVDSSTDQLSEYASAVSCIVSKGCEILRDEDLGVIPTNKAIEFLPKEESRLTQSISRRSVYNSGKCDLTASRSTVVVQKTEFRFKKHSREVLEGLEAVPCEENNREDRLQITVELLLLYYVTSLVLGKRYQDARNVIMEFEERNECSLLVKAHLAKIMGIIMALLDSSEAARYFYYARKAFAQENLYLGQAACNLGLANIKKLYKAESLAYYKAALGSYQAERHHPGIAFSSKCIKELTVSSQSPLKCQENNSAVAWTKDDIILTAEIDLCSLRTLLHQSNQQETTITSTKSTRIRELQRTPSALLVKRNPTFCHQKTI